MKKYIALAVALIMTLGCAQTAFADETSYNLSAGDKNLEIKESNSNYIVTSNGETPHAIIVDSGVKTSIVLDGVNINSEDRSGIIIRDGAEVNLVLKGKNLINVNNYTAAGIDLANGTLTIGGEGSINIKHQVMEQALVLMTIKILQE